MNFEPSVKGGFFYSHQLPIFATTSRRSFGARSKKWFNMLRLRSSADYRAFFLLFL